MDHGLFDLPVVGASNTKDAGSDYSRRDRNDEDFGELISARETRADESAPPYSSDAGPRSERHDLRGDAVEPQSGTGNADLRDVGPRADAPQEKPTAKSDEPTHTPNTAPETKPTDTSEAPETTGPAADQTQQNDPLLATNVSAANAAPQAIVEQLAATPPPLTPALGRPVWSRDADATPNAASAGNIAQSHLNTANLTASPALEGASADLIPGPVAGGADAQDGLPKPAAAAPAGFDVEAPVLSAGSETLDTAVKLGVDATTLPPSGEQPPQIDPKALVPPDGAIEEPSTAVEIPALGSSNNQLNGATASGATPEIADQAASASPIAPTAAQSTSTQARPNASAATVTNALRSSAARPGTATPDSAANQPANMASPTQNAAAQAPTPGANSDLSALATGPRTGDVPPDLAVFRETLATVLPDAAGTQSADAVKSAGRIVAAELTGRPQLLHPSLTDQVTIRIREAFDAGDSQVRIQLQPKELGRIDVRMEITESGRMSALVVAERPDTLELLMRDARGLERALQQAGFETDSNSLSFDLEDRDEPAGDPQAGPEDSGAETAGPDPALSEDISIDLAALLSGDPAARGIDISV